MALGSWGLYVLGGAGCTLKCWYINCSMLPTKGGRPASSS